MKKVKIIIFILCIFTLTACGAVLQYKMNVNTSNENINIEISMKIEEDDYQYIEGGRDRLIEIINENKPDIVTFQVADTDANTYIFQFVFDNFNEYTKTYEQITGIPSISTFDIIDYSEDSPFISSKHIELKDDLSKLLDWLKNKLIDVGAVTQGNKEKLVKSQEFKYSFNDKKENTYGNTKIYDEKEVIEILNTDVSVLIKQDNIIDFNLSFYVNQDHELFIEHFSNYINNKNIKEANLQYEISNCQGKECVRFDIILKDIDLQDENTKAILNSVFGESFIQFTSNLNEEGNFLVKNYQQELNLEFSFSDLFDRDVTNPSTVTINLDNVEYVNENSREMPSVDSNGNYYNMILTEYRIINYFVIFGIFLFIIIVIVMIRKFGVKNLQNRLSKCQSVIKNYVYNKFFEKEIHIYEKLIEGDTFLIQISNIAKINYGKRKSKLFILISYSTALLSWCSIHLFLNNILDYLVLVILIIILIIYYIVNRTDTLFIELASGKSYSFLFKDKHEAIKKYYELIKHMDINQSGYSSSQLIEILNMVGGKENEKI